LMVAVAPDAETRGRVAARLKEAGIQTSLHYPCIPDFTALVRYRASEVGQSRAFAGRAVALPLFPTPSAAQVAAVTAVLAAAARPPHRRSCGWRGGSPPPPPAASAAGGAGAAG